MPLHSFTHAGSTRGMLSTICVLVVLATACDTSDRAGRRPLSEGPVGSGTDASGSGLNDALPPGMTAIAAAHLDSGNVAFRARQFEQALTYYRAAAVDVPRHPAPWYGILMVGQSTGNRALVDSATAAVAARSGGGDLLQSTAAKAHQSPSASSLPAGHSKDSPTK